MVLLTKRSQLVHSPLFRAALRLCHALQNAPLRFSLAPPISHAHGHALPLPCSANPSRCSIALLYPCPLLCSLLTHCPPMLLPQLLLRLGRRLARSDRPWRVPVQRARVKGRGLQESFASSGRGDLLSVRRGESLVSVSLVPGWWRRARRRAHPGRVARVAAASASRRGGWASLARCRGPAEPAGKH